MSIDLPHRKVLILASVCISVILISLSYQVMTRKKASAGLYTGTITAVAGETEEASMADKRVLEALDQAREEELGALATSTNPFDPSPKDSLSDRFTKDIFSAFLKLETSPDGQISDDELAANAINNIKTDDLPKARYNLADLKIFVPKDKKELHDYGNMLAQQYLTAILPVNSNPEKYSINASALSPIYKDVGTKFLQVSAPNEIANTQLELANSFFILAETFPIIDNQQKDPVKSILGLRIVQEMLPKQKDLFTKISDYFTLNGILFSSDEPGVMWNPNGAPNLSAGTGASSTLLVQPTTAN